MHLRMNMRCRARKRFIFHLIFSSRAIFLQFGHGFVLIAKQQKTTKYILTEIVAKFSVNMR